MHTSTERKTASLEWKKKWSRAQSLSKEKYRLFMAEAAKAGKEKRKQAGTGAELGMAAVTVIVTFAALF